MKRRALYSASPDVQAEPAADAARADAPSGSGTGAAGSRAAPGPCDAPAANRAATLTRFKSFGAGKPSA